MIILTFDKMIPAFHIIRTSFLLSFSWESVQGSAIYLYSYFDINIHLATATCNIQYTDI